MNTKILLVALAVVCAIQWAVPVWLMQRAQITLAQGSVYRFRTMPIDPLDPFRGRYIALDFEAARVKLRAGGHRFATGERLYAPILVGEDGYARLGLPLPTPPVHGDYLPVRVEWIGDEEIGLRLPFDRYYLDESRARAVEQAHAQADRSHSEADAHSHAVVRVRNGDALIEELYIDHRPVSAWLRARHSVETGDTR